MALTIHGLERAFEFEKNRETIALSDPNPSMTPDAVMHFYSNSYPELTTATVQGPEIRDDRSVYMFKTTLGTKG